MLYIFKYAVVYLNLGLSANALHMNLISYLEFPEGYSIIVLDDSKFILLCFTKSWLFRISSFKLI